MASLYTTTVAPNCSDITKFKALFQWICDNLINIGLVQTADTGQVDWGTIAAVPASAVYQMFRFDDAQQATNPVFIRLSMYAASNCPRWTVEIANSTDGASGLIYSVGGSPYTGATSVDTTARAAFVSGNGAAGTAAAFLGLASSQVTNNSGFVIERSRDANGDFTDEYVNLFAFLDNGAGYETAVHTLFKPGTGIRFSNVGTSNKIYLSAWGCALPSNIVLGGNTAVSPIYLFGKSIGAMSKMMVSARAADCSEGQQKTVNLYGTDHNFYFMKAQAQWGHGVHNNACLGVLYE
jgi:hypothetical protein